MNSSVEAAVRALQPGSLRDARRFKSLVRWSADARSEAARVGGLQVCTSALGRAARSGSSGTLVAELADALAFCALDVRNKEVMVDDTVQAGGCDVYEVARLTLVQMQRQGGLSSGGDAGGAGGFGAGGSKYAPAPSFAGADPVPLAALCRLVWNVSTIDNAFTRRVAAGGAGEATKSSTASLITLLVAECVWTEERREAATATEASDDCRLQLWGALWALSGSASTLQSDAWLPLFKHAISILDESGRRRTDDVSVEVARRSAAAMSPMLRGSAKALPADAPQPPFVLAHQRHLVVAVVGMLGHALDNAAIREHVRDLNGSDDVLSRLLTAADPETDDKIIALTRMALGKLVAQDAP